MIALLLGLTAAAVVALVCIGRVRRLHRLHIRTDAARDGLDAALRRRSVVAARVLPDVGPAPAELGPDRETVENALGRRLAALDRAAVAPALRAELADAERLVVLGRLVYHDAVRDTRALRSRRLVRWLRLAGTAPLPAYFEIAAFEIVDPRVPDRGDGAVTSDSTTGDGPTADVASGVR